MPANSRSVASLNKLVSNVAAGRNAGGVHWRSDYPASITLGETVAISILEEQKITFNESSSFTFTKFDGRRSRSEEPPAPLR